jgi:prepilin-type N-terminal cleavage/methylation domain-containing protein
MKKNTIKAFTLVEMLIVIVIIGILIASLMPRMQSAQWRARDVARKNDLSQIQTSIITSQADRGAWPGMPWNMWKDTAGTDNTTVATGWIQIKKIASTLQDAWMTQIPTDPNGSNDNYWFGDLNAKQNTENYWQYIYMVWKRNWVKHAWFALMAKTEVEGSSNWVVCSGATTSWWWYLKHDDDLAHVTLCSSITKSTSPGSCRSNTGACIYDETQELRYILLY